MTSLVLACLWAVAANLAGMLPSRRNHWPAALVLSATAGPLIAWVTLENGVWIGLLVVAACASVLRWPLLFAARFVVRAARGLVSRA